jgi:hypothetical protein
VTKPELQSQSTIVEEPSATQSPEDASGAQDLSDDSAQAIIGNDASKTSEEQKVTKQKRVRSRKNKHRRPLLECETSFPSLGGGGTPNSDVSEQTVVEASPSRVSWAAKASQT